MTIKITWIAHSAFALDIDGHSVLIDPFITGNALATTTADDYSPEIILLSHAHGDHLGDTVDIAKRTEAPVISNFEIGNWLLANGVPNVAQIMPGGTHSVEFMDVTSTIAHHGSSFPDGTYGGQPNGFVIKAAGKNIYFAGDTDVFLEMQLIGERGIDLAILPIGDKFTMGIDGSLKSIGFIKPKMTIPMHYNTFPVIMQDAGAWAERVNKETDSTPIVLDPGKSYTLE